jgi:hypothetical protein
MTIYVKAARHGTLALTLELYTDRRASCVPAAHAGVHLRGVPTYQYQPAYGSEETGYHAVPMSSKSKTALADTQIDRASCLPPPGPSRPDRFRWLEQTQSTHARIEMHAWRGRVVQVQVQPERSRQSPSTDPCMHASVFPSLPPGKSFSCASERPKI